MTAPALQVVHNAAARRFETTVEGQLARADYQLDEDVMRLVHTGVPRAHRTCASRPCAPMSRAT
jgi:predicted GNAT family acetyltransferase